MAIFVEVTEVETVAEPEHGQEMETDVVLVNLDIVRTIRRPPKSNDPQRANYVTIYFIDGEYIRVEESFDRIRRELELAGTKHSD